jgi:hypothetical protein
MAMPSSGSIGLVSAPQTCGSIACAVCGTNASPPYSLNTLSAAAGKSAPHSMLEFYGYSPAPTWKTVYFSNISSTCPNYDDICECTCACLTTSSAMASGDCYFPAFSWNFYKPTTAAPTPVCVHLLCNGVTKYCCGFISKTAYSCSGTWAAFSVDSNDCIHAITHAEILTDCVVGSTATVTLCAVNVCVGCYCVGSPATVYSETCSSA